MESKCPLRLPRDLTPILQRSLRYDKRSNKMTVTRRQSGYLWSLEKDRKDQRDTRKKPPIIDLSYLALENAKTECDSSRRCGRVLWEDIGKFGKDVIPSGSSKLVQVQFCGKGAWEYCV